MSIFLGVLFLALPVTIYCDSAQGKFTLDHEGIRQIPLFKKPRYFHWEDVERLKWDEIGCCLEKKATVISIKFVPLTREAKSLLESVLSPHFDLSIKPIRQWSFEPNIHSFLRWLAKVVGISVAGAVLFIVPFSALILLHASRWIVCSWFGLFLLGTIMFLAWGSK